MLVRPKTQAVNAIAFCLILTALLIGALRNTSAAASDPILVTQEQLHSKLVKKSLPYNVVLPRNYDAAEARNKRYPVIYLLHGLSGHFSDWTTRTKLSLHSRQHDVLIVTPEGNDGWYTDSETVPDDKYESYIIQELIPEVDRKFRTIASREGRAIAGLSMGGYGSLKFGVKYPQKFAFVGSMSGALDAATWTESDLKGFVRIWQSLVIIFGPADSQTRRANDIVRLYRQLSASEIKQLPYIYLDCGTEDPFLRSNQDFAAVLLQQKISHQIRLLPGTHGWAYWNQQVVEVLRVATSQMVPVRNSSASQSQ